jgi:hypothetical protein
MFGIISTITANNEATVLRAFNYSRSSVALVLQEDQCLSEAAFHSTGETIGLLVLGELDYVTSHIDCKIRYHSLLENIEPPTFNPSAFPSTNPSAEPSSAPTELGDLTVKNFFDGGHVVRNSSYLLITLYDTFGDGWQNGTFFFLLD